MLENLNKYRVILASNSPRRKELLSGLGVPFTVRIIDGIDETYPDDLTCEEIPCYISRKKAQAYVKDMAEDELIITADTVVCVDDVVLGKPVDETDAMVMLRTLSGKTHQVITGVTLLTHRMERTFSVASHVTFGSLTEEEIEYYVKNYRPLDKAGAYGIQEWIGYVGVTALNGSYFNVMGLPVQRLYNELKSI